MLRFQSLVVLCLLVSLPKGGKAECSMSDEKCEFWLEISNKMTMMHGRDAVYPYKGKLYKYDVPEAETNDTEPINPDDVVVADGWEVHRQVTVTNGKMPGPPIEVYENQTVVVHVTNKLAGSGVTIHWHGLHQRDTPWMDGVAFVTQCPIEPGQKFTYRFKAFPKGTFWYHSHIGTQMGMGLVGAFIIRERKPLEMPEHIMVLQHWNHDWDAEISLLRVRDGSYLGRQKLSRTHSLDGAAFSQHLFQSGLINGRGRYFGGTNVSNSSPLTVYEVEEGQTYRFRVIGATIVYPFRVSVDGHSLTVVASDGYELSPFEVESIVIQTGERYDFVIQANQTTGNYWIRAESLEVDVVNHIALAILRYQGAEEEDPTSERKQCMASDRCTVANCPFSYYPADSYTDCINYGQFRAAESYQTPGKDESMNEEIEDVFLNFGFPGTTARPPSVNGRALQKPPAPPLTQPDMFTTMCNDGHNCGEQKLCFCAPSLNLQHNKVYQLVFISMGNGRGRAHPIHLHGHSFYVVKMGYPPYNTTTGVLLGDSPDIDCGGNVADPKNSFCNQASWANSSWGGNSVPGLELESPPRKDTIIVPMGGYAVVRIRADNPGVWFMHCHNELHILGGMALMVNESFEHQKPPPAGFPNCGNFDFVSEDTNDDDDNNISSKHSESDDCKEEEIYWAVIGSLGGVILFQLVVNIYFCRRFNK